MNCFQYRIPGTPSLRIAISLFSRELGESLDLSSVSRIPCLPVFEESLFRLSDPSFSSHERAEIVGLVERLLDELSADPRVHSNQEEYRALRLLQAEAHCSISEYQEAGDTTGFLRFEEKLRDKITPPLAPIDSAGIESAAFPEIAEHEAEPISNPGQKPRRFFRDLARAAGFIATFVIFLNTVDSMPAIAG
ncbi:MAG: hypothetical protein KDN19_10820 [Verrucomicrobiae bacterium]|nr:hypothetical protein [Verrucomicrobiae bacterium]